MAGCTHAYAQVWFIGALANIMCFILAWIYIFDSTQLEIKALDDAQAVSGAPQALGRHACARPGGSRSKGTLGSGRPRRRPRCGSALFAEALWWDGEG